MNFSKDSYYLRYALLGNAVFSAASGRLMIFATDSVANAVGAVPSIVFELVGWALVLFATDLLIMAVLKKERPLLVWGAVVGDWLWVIATPICWLLFASFFSATGILITAVIAMIVAGFAVAQTRGIQRLSLGA